MDMMIMFQEWKVWSGLLCYRKASIYKKRMQQKYIDIMALLYVSM